MNTIVSMLGNLLGYVMDACYTLVHNYGFAIIVFTFMTKVILLPLSIMVHKNSIKMVKMQPELNFSKAENFGDQDRIGEEQLKLFKKYNYHPMLGLVPLLIQLVLLMGVIDVIYKPFNHILRFPGEVIAEVTARFSGLSGVSLETNSIQIAVVDALKKGEYLEELGAVLGAERLQEVLALNLHFAGINLAEVPVRAGGILILVPLLAAFCAWLLCVVQNHINVLQSEQGKINKIGTMLLSVGLSLYLGFFVPAGVGLYWMFSNLFAIVQLLFLNAIISPRKYIDYGQLEASKKALAKVSRRANASKKLFARDPYRKRERADYKRFYKLYHKQVVFYSEKNGFYKYFENIIAYLLENSDIIIDYVSSDPNDAVFSRTGDRFRTYYIGDKRLISFMMKMDANVVVMTTPDLEKYHIKRSLVRKDIEYIYLPHGVNSPNTSLRTGALDYYDTIFAQGPRAEQEIRAIEKLHGTKEKTIIPWGSSVLDNMVEKYGQMEGGNLKKTILIAPSWQEDNILDVCIEELLDQLLPLPYEVILRPHPQYLRYAMDRIEELKRKYAGHGNFVLQTDFSSNETVYQADLLVTDWSGIAFEYSFSTLKPTLFINTPMKIMNPEWKAIHLEPIDIAIRKLVGRDMDLDDIGKAGSLAGELIAGSGDYREKIAEVRSREIYNLHNSGKTGGEYILKAAKRIEDNKEEYMKYL